MLGMLAIGAAIVCAGLALYYGWVGRQPGAAQSRGEISVYAAASLRDAMAELAPLLEQRLGTRLTVNLGSSGDLARQIIAGEQADVFLSADEQEMDRLADLELVEADTRRDFLTNQLVVIEPFEQRPDWHTNFPPPFAAEQLAQPVIARLSLANVETVPAGRYAKAWLERCGVWPRVAERVLPGINVRAALAAVESGAAEAGVVYRSDAARTERVRVVYAVPRDAGPEIVYPRAMLRSARQPALAREVLEFIDGDEAAKLFERHGFEVLPRSR